MLSTVLKAAEQASSPPHTPLPVIASTSSMWEIEELPDEQEIHPSHSAANASTSTNEEIEEIHEIKGQATSPVIHASQTQHMDTDDHLIASSPKVEDPDIDIAIEQLEGGDSVDDFGGDDISLWQNEVKLLPSKSGNCLLIDNCFFIRGRKEGRMERKTGATRKA